MEADSKSFDVSASQGRFPEGIKFKFEWRDYQERVLNELEHHLEDNHLHVIAPPGSGKTILGLEVMLRLNKPALVFAPTVSIRNQWILRFTEMFLQLESTPDWISKDIRNPKLLTVVTYQALYAACTGEVELEDDHEDEEENLVTTKKALSKSKTKALIGKLKEQNVGTLVVDEAHHLKNAWWKPLMEVKKELNATIVGLTATPPYDVSYNEWERYIQLNGPVDAEISVPELVVEGDLCPHQDYIHFCYPTDGESEEIALHKNRIRTLFDSLQKDETLIEAIRRHPIFLRPQANLEWIYSNLEFYSATLIFLNKIGKEITLEHKEVIGDKKVVIPELTYEWIEILLTFYLYEDPENFIEYVDHQEELINRLKRNGAMNRRAVRFNENKKAKTFLSNSLNKLESIGTIVEFEHSSLKADLRMVILSDFIRKEYLVESNENTMPLTKMGVLPIFEQLRRNVKSDAKIGVLTGSLVVIPRSALDSLQSIAQKMGLPEVSSKPVSFDNNYLIVSSSEKLKHVIVHVITQVFEKGDIEVLVGTKSLLGEGWDAPSINSLILASFVGSYVLSNQMRGRAIRTQRLNVGKTGNIWHLVCVDKNTEGGGADLELLKRRFKAFVGVSFHNESYIENGIDRLEIPEEIRTQDQLDKLNKKMFTAALARTSLKDRWSEALDQGAYLVEEIRVPFDDERSYQSVKSFYYSKTIKYLVALFGAGLLMFLDFGIQVFAQVGVRSHGTISLSWYFVFLGGIGVLFFGRVTWKTFRIYVSYRDISDDIDRIAQALLATLIQNGVILTDRSELEIKTEINERGVIYCHLKGGATFERSTFIKSLEEIVGEIDNPRYVMIRKSSFQGLFAQKDYHSVPEIIGGKKKLAQNFETNWMRFVGTCELIYTRTIEGRKLLLKSRIKSLSAQFKNKSERVNRWKE